MLRQLGQQWLWDIFKVHYEAATLQAFGPLKNIVKEIHKTIAVENMQRVHGTSSA